MKGTHIGTGDEDGFVDLVSEHLGLDQANRDAVDADQALALLYEDAKKTHQPVFCGQGMFILSARTLA